MALAESTRAPSRPAPRPAAPSFRAERALFHEGYVRVAGVDEAGRGPLAGPVVAAAVVLDPKRIPKGINDSKQLDAAAREALFARLCATAEISFAFGSVRAIDTINIFHATMTAMRRAVQGLACAADIVLVDGNMVPKEMPCEARPLVGGDATCLSIAAASIVAKVIRDRLMTRCDDHFGGYGLASHKGYSTKAHQAALVSLGPCRLHRRSFWRVAACFEAEEGMVGPAGLEPATRRL
jgi:ribonuclease HII